MTTIEELRSLHKTWCHGAHDGEVVLRAADELSALQKENAELNRIIELHHQSDRVIEAERQIFRTRISELERIVKVKDEALVLVLDHPVVTAEELFRCRKALALQPGKP